VPACQQFPNYGKFGHVADAADGQARIEAILGQFAGPLARTGGRDMLLCAGDDHPPVRRELPSLCAELERRLPGSEFRIARRHRAAPRLAGLSQPVRARAGRHELRAAALDRGRRGVLVPEGRRGRGRPRAALL
jgi:hypothetical protein